MLIYIVVIILSSSVYESKDDFSVVAENLSIHSFLNLGFQELLRGFDMDMEMNKFTLKFVVLLVNGLLNTPEVNMNTNKELVLKFDRKSLIYVHLVFNSMGISRLKRDLKKKYLNHQDIASFKFSEFFADQDIMTKEIVYADKSMMALVKDNKLIFDDIIIKEQVYKLNIDNVNTDFKNTNQSNIGYPLHGNRFTYIFGINPSKAFDEYILNSDILVENYKFLGNLISDADEIDRKKNIKHIKILFVLALLFLCTIVVIVICTILYFMKRKIDNNVYLGEGL